MNPENESDTIVKEIKIKAPAERIFEALTNPDQRLKWWGAEGQYRGTHMESDLRLGGKWMTRGVGRGGKPFSVGAESTAISSVRVCWSLRGFLTGKRMRQSRWYASICMRRTASQLFA